MRVAAVVEKDKPTATAILLGEFLQMQESQHRKKSVREPGLKIEEQRLKSRKCMLVQSYLTDKQITSNQM